MSLISFSSVMTGATVGCESVDGEGRRNVTAHLTTWDGTNRAYGETHMVISPKQAREFGLALIEQAARAEAWTEQHRPISV